MCVPFVPVRLYPAALNWLFSESEETTSKTVSAVQPPTGIFKALRSLSLKLVCLTTKPKSCLTTTPKNDFNRTTTLVNFGPKWFFHAFLFLVVPSTLDSNANGRSGTIPAQQQIITCKRFSIIILMLINSKEEVGKKVIAIAWPRTRKSSTMLNKANSLQPATTPRHMYGVRCALLIPANSKLQNSRYCWIILLTFNLFREEKLNTKLFDSKL